LGFGINRIGHCKWDQGTIMGIHAGTGFCINLLGIFIYVNIFNAFFLVKTIMKINMKQQEEILNSFKYQACVGGHQNWSTVIRTGRKHVDHLEMQCEECEGCLDSKCEGH
jgi:hypothetical protein